jgi:hypothetical protein
MTQILRGTVTVKDTQGNTVHVSLYTEQTIGGLSTPYSVAPGEEALIGLQPGQQGTWGYGTSNTTTGSHALYVYIPLGVIEITVAGTVLADNTTGNGDVQLNVLGIPFTAGTVSWAFSGKDIDLILGP